MKKALSIILAAGVFLSPLGFEKSAEAATNAQELISFGKQYMGVPYVWGGTTPSGFDCSGFMTYVYGNNGVSIPRTTADQYYSGTSVSRSNLQLGDIVFFTTYRAGPSHAGIYIGNNQFLHASSSRGVTISGLSDYYWKDRYIGARRYFKSETSAAELVDKAKGTATVLKWAISVEGSADGSTRPWNQYNSAKDARSKAVSAIQSLNDAAEKERLMAIIQSEVDVHITRAMYYIDAITAGEKIESKKVDLQTRIDADAIDDGTEDAYHQLSTEIRKQAILLDRVYGKSTRDEIRDNYKGSAEAVRDQTKYAVTVKINLDEIEKTITTQSFNEDINYLVSKVETFLPKVQDAEIQQKLEQRLSESVVTINSLTNN